MATILKFCASEKPASSDLPRRLKASAGAEIVIFPGIRYEYWADKDESAAPVTEQVAEGGKSSAQ